MKKYFERLYKKSAGEYYIQLSKYLDNNEKKFIVTANPETFKIAKTNKTFENLIFDKNNDIIPDGIAVVKAAKHYRIKIKERITGFDTTVKLLEFANQKKKSVYFFGAKKEVLDALVIRIKETYSKIKILGATDGYVSDKEKVMKEIISLNPDVCFVALGIPEQELLIGKYINKVKKGIYIGVGGSLDVLSGTKKRAPKIFIKLNLEWLYRIVKEPKRFKRFYQNNIKFIVDVLKDRDV